MSPTRPIAFLLTAGISLACTKGAVDIGDPAGGAALADYVGTWNGYTEGYAVRSTGSDRLRLTIAPSGKGTVEFGDAEPVPPPTDPNAGYPPDFDARYGAVGGDNVYDPTDGFRYPLHEPQIVADRLRFGIFPNDLFDPWCALMKPLLLSDYGEYGCTHFDWRAHDMPEVCGELACCATLRDIDGGYFGVDCMKFYYCAIHLCECTAKSCSAPAPAPGELPVNQYRVYFDVTLEEEATRLTGTMFTNGETPRRITVRLERD
jgi:hypothetical protein